MIGRVTVCDFLHSFKPDVLPMTLSIAAYILLILGLLGWSTVTDPDVRYPAAAMAVLGAILAVEGAVARVIAAVRDLKE